MHAAARASPAQASRSYQNCSSRLRQGGEQCVWKTQHPRECVAFAARMDVAERHRHAIGRGARS